MRVGKSAGSWLLAGLFGFSTPVAQAAVSLPLDAGPVTTSVFDAVVAPGGQASPTVSFTFDVPFDMVAILLGVDYDGALMTFNAGASTLAIGGAAVPLGQVPAALQLAAGVPFTALAPQDDPGTFMASGSFDDPGSFVVPAGTYVFTPVFDLKLAFTAGMQTQVNVWGDVVASSGPPAMFNADLTVTAVPEPETWLMLLGGLGLLASRVRRHKR